MRTALIVLRKDLLLELRGFETLPAMVLFSIATFVIFHFGLNRPTIDGQLAFFAADVETGWLEELCATLDPAKADAIRAACGLSSGLSGPGG